MELLVSIPAVIIFLYSLYRLSGDDHVLIRKNISLEQMFDAAFGTLWVSLLVSRIYFFLVDQKITSNIFIAFFTTKGGLSLVGAILGGILALYLIGKYKRIPLGRLFDFFTLSLLFALPAGFAGIILLNIKRPMVIITFAISAVIYLACAIIFRKILYPKLLNRTLKEGNISIFFLLLFSLVSFASSFVPSGGQAVQLVTVNNIVYVALALLGLILFFKQERGKVRRLV